MTTELTLLIVFMGTAFCVSGIAFFLYSLYIAEKVTVEKRFNAFAKKINALEYQEQALTLLKKRKDGKQLSFFSDLPPFLNLPTLFEQAGMHADPGRWLIVVLFLAGTVASIASLTTKSWFILLLAVAAVILIPYLFVLLKRKRRLSAFEAGLSQALEIISRSLKAGHPLAMGLQMVSQELPDPIGAEFGRLFYEQQMGLPFEDTLHRMAQRVPLLDLRFFVLSILIHQQTGGDLAEVLDNLSHVIRDRFKVMGQVKALTAEGRLSGWVLSALPIVVFVMIWVVNRGYITILLEEDLGRRMLCIAGFFQVVGMIVIQKIVRIKV